MEMFLLYLGCLSSHSHFMLAWYGIDPLETFVRIDQLPLPVIEASTCTSLPPLRWRWHLLWSIRMNLLSYMVY